MSEPCTLYPSKCITSAMPDMPMPPMPTKWIVPRSVPIAFIMRARPPPGTARGCVRRGPGPPRPERDLADLAERVGEVPRGMRPADRQGARCGIGERDRIGGHRLDLPRQDGRREVRLLDRPGAAGMDHLARIGGLVVVSRRGIGNEDRGAPRRGQLGDG